MIRDHPIRGEDQRDFLVESEGSPPPLPQDSLPDAGEARNDFWSMSGNFMYRHHVETQSQTLLGNTLISPELRRQTWMLCKKAASMTIGISMDQEICVILGQISLSLLY